MKPAQKRVADYRTTLYEQLPFIEIAHLFLIHDDL